MENLNEIAEDLSEKIHRISVLKIWLEKYFPDFLIASATWNNGSCFDEFPCSCTRNSNERKFMILYEAIQEVVALHDFEEYFEKEVSSFDENKLDAWLNKNEELGSEKFVAFVLDYLDYDDEVHHLSVFVRSFPELNILVDREDFKNTIQFLEIFNEHYWKRFA